MDPVSRNRRFSLRLQEFDYAQPGAYYVTVVAQNRQCMFAEIDAQGTTRLTRFGRVVMQVWSNLPRHYNHVVLDAFCIMPNHIHGIIVIADPNVPRHGRGGSPLSGPGSPPTEATPGGIPLPTGQTRPYTPGEPTPTGNTAHSLSEIVRALKSFSALRINAARKTPGVQVWQRNYYEHVVRNEKELNRIRQYFLDNPIRWTEDTENPANTEGAS